jgi:archaellum component FlaD/FlaE
LGCSGRLTADWRENNPDVESAEDSRTTRNRQPCSNTLFKTADQIEQRYQKAKSYIDQLTQSILAKAFRGELVPQDPNDEPASVLLERIRAERENRENVAKTAKKPAVNKKQRSKKAQPQLEPKAWIKASSVNSLETPSGQYPSGSTGSHLHSSSPAAKAKQL